MTREQIEEIKARALARTGEEIAEKALCTPEAIGRALFQSICVRRDERKAERRAEIEAQIRSIGMWNK